MGRPRDATLTSRRPDRMPSLLIRQSGIASSLGQPLPPLVNKMSTIRWRERTLCTNDVTCTELPTRPVRSGRRVEARTPPWYINGDTDIRNVTLVRRRTFVFGAQPGAREVTGGLCGVHSGGDPDRVSITLRGRDGWQIGADERVCVTRTSKESRRREVMSGPTCP